MFNLRGIDRVTMAHIHIVALCMRGTNLKFKRR